MPIILSLETATKAGSVALHDNGQLVADFEILLENSHSGTLTLMVEHLLQLTGYAKHNLNAIAVSEGPGSYTGLRIGMATAKGLCFALDKPLITVSTLAAMARQVNHFNTSAHLVCPMIDARRMEVYCAIYDDQNNVVSPVSPHIIADGAFAEHLAHRPVIFAGDGAAKCKPVFADQPNALFVDQLYPAAKYVGEIATAHYAAQLFADLAYTEPFYLKEHMAAKKQD